MKKNNYGYGCIPSPKDLRDYKVAMTKEVVYIPASYEVEHSKIKNQGSVGSCVAHGISELLETNDEINYSTGWIYGYRPEDYYQGKGMIPSQALKTVNKVGYLENSQLDVNEEMNAAKLIVDANLDTYINQASERKIKSYARLNNIDEIKETIYASGKPILIVFEVGVNGLELDKNYIAKVPTEYDGSHLTVCYGWNDNGLLIQNSWGEDWGNKGTFILPYSYPIAEAWMIEFPSELDDIIEPDIIIEKPNWYWLRELIMMIIKWIRNLRK